MTGLRAPEEVGVRVVADSFALFRWLDLPPGQICCDVGSGNGWPGLALKVRDPSVRLVLIEKRRSSCEFLRTAVTAMGFEDVEVWNMPAEEAGADEVVRGTFDTVLSRAVGRLAVALELSAPLAKEGGRVVLWLGRADADFLRGAVGAGPAGAVVTALGLRKVETWEYWLPGGGGARAIAILEKTDATDRRFPRSGGAIRKRPLW